MDPATAVIIAASIAALASVLTAYINVADRRKLKETHHQTTQNSGVSNPPTIPDKLADIKSELRDIKGSLSEQGVKLDFLWDLNVNHSNTETTKEQ